MKTSLLRHLVDPHNGDVLTLDVTKRDGDEIIEGTLSNSIGGVYPIVRGIPRFISSDLYANTFSRQRQLARQHFGTYKSGADRHKNDVDLFERTTGFSLSKMNGVTLDAGCGYGRFLHIIRESYEKFNIDGEIIGVDLSSDSVDLAYDFINRSARVHIIQADLTNLPFRQNYFDRIFSIGVLHHTPSTKEAFLSLVPHLREGGEIAIWVYSPHFKKSSNRWRKITTKIPIDLVYAWCIVNEIVFVWPRSIPFVGPRFFSLIPGGNLSTPFWQRVLGGFDDLTPTYAHVHNWDEVVQWFHEASLSEIMALDRKTSVKGKKI
jgi:SAM-dependent methyltransferase